MPHNWIWNIEPVKTQLAIRKGQSTTLMTIEIRTAYCQEEDCLDQCVNHNGNLYLLKSLGNNQFESSQYKEEAANV